jgi:signal transduction histidine kinase
MRVRPAVAAVPLLLLLLTWLSFRAIEPDAEQFDHALGALDHFETVESALQRDVLSARIGILRNYDPLAQETDALDVSILRLRETAATDAETAATVDRLAESVVRQEHLIEQFKSDNALLQNSQAYFRLYSTRLGAANRTGPVAPAVNGLTAAISHLTLDTSPESVREVEDWLGDLAGQTPPSGDADAVKALLAHGRMLHDLLPTTDLLLKGLRPVRRTRAQADLRTMVGARQSASRTTARAFRLLLYVASLLLVAVLAYVGLQLLARTLALQRHAAFEHVLARISTRFLNARTNAIGENVQQALAELSERVGADRAYFVPSRPSIQRHTWSRTASDFPPGWPDRAPELADRFRRTAEGIIHVPFVDRLPPGGDKDALLAAGLHSWVCVPSRGEEGGMGLLGFDALDSGVILRSGEFGLLRMALNSVTNVLGRGYLQQERERLDQRLQQSRRMETVGALTSGIAHNFNNIIAAILGYAEIAVAQVASGSRPAHDIAEIRRAGERARDLVDQILTFGRRRDTRREPMSVRDLVTEAASLLRVSLPGSIELAVHDTTGSAIISGERGQLQQVILNLCNNAAQAVGGFGRIDLEAEIHENAQARPLSHGDLPPGRYLSIAVSDAGGGMEEAVLSRIFEPFFTTRAAGTGLGLATVLEIVREHGGMMNVRTVPQAGSRFEAWLPCTPTDTSASSEALPMLPLGRGQTVLVVDEERGQLPRDEEILAALGYEPVGFTHADDALMACRNAPERFDVLVVGHLVPTTRTLEFAAALHAVAPHVPLLLAAAWASEAGADALMAAGISDVVHWPIIVSEIAAALIGSSAVTGLEEKTPGDPCRGSYS